MSKIQWIGNIQFSQTKIFNSISPTFGEYADISLTPHTHTHTPLTALFPGQPRWASTRKVKPIWILLEQETVSGSGISWAICKSAPCSRQIPCQHPTTQFFTGRMPFLPPNQQRQSTEGITPVPAKFPRTSRFYRQEVTLILCIRCRPMTRTSTPKHRTNLGCNYTTTTI